MIVFRFGFYLELIVSNVDFAQIPKRRLFVDLVTNDERSDEKDFIRASVKSDVNVSLLERHELALFRLLRLDKLGADSTLHDERIAQVANAKH